jgi:hypothetical protein
MLRLLRVALTSLVAFTALVFVLASVEGALDIPLETRHLIGIAIAAVSAIAAGALGAWQATVGGYRADAAALVAAIAPPAVLAVVLASLSGAPTDINVAVAAAGTLGAAVGAAASAYFYQLAQP